MQTFDKLRYADTDRQGHVNNVASAETVIVQVNNKTGRGERLGEAARERLGQWLLRDGY